MAITEIKSYKVWVTNRQLRFSDKNFILAASIVGYGDDGRRICVITIGESLTGDIISNFRLSDDAFRVFAPRDRYSMCLDLLRNEGPIKFYIDASDLNKWSLTTSEKEAVASGDMD